MILKNAKVTFAKLVMPDDYKGKKKWVINIYPNAEQMSDLKIEGVRIREDKQGNEYVIASRNCTSTKGEKVDPPGVVDIYKQPFAKSIGNNSVCNIICDVIDLSKNDDYKGNMLYLKKVQVVKLVDGDEDFDELEGQDIEDDDNSPI